MDAIVRQVNRLIRLIARGSLSALDRLFSLTSRMLFAMANKYLFDKSFAEDLVSDTYLKVVRGSHSFDSTRNGLNWIYKILKNGAMDYNRRSLSPPCHENIIIASGINDDNIDDWLNCILVNDAVEKLSDEEKHIIYLRYWEGLRLNEIAEQLNKPLTTTHDMIKRTLNKLKAFIDDPGEV